MALYIGIGIGFVLGNIFMLWLVQEVDMEYADEPRENR